MMRRALGATLVVDAVSVGATFALAASASESRAWAFGVAFVGLAGLVLAFAAVAPLFVRVGGSRSPAIRRGPRLIWIGLVINSVGCAVLLAAAPSNPALGVVLLAGGDILSVLYLSFFAAKSSRSRSRAD
jgi:hypothetical protein